MPGVELADGERYTAQAAGRNHGGHAASIGQAGVEDGARFRDVVAETAGNVLDGDHQSAVADRDSVSPFEKAILLEKDAVAAIDHDFADRVVDDEVFDRFEEGKNCFESVHHSAPSASC